MWTLFLYSMVVLAQDPANLQGQRPKLEFQKHRIDLGEVYRGQHIKQNFFFTNTGNGVLHIRSIHAACGCISTQVSPKDVFQPGEEGKVEVVFDSSDFSGSTLRTITIDSDAPAPSTVTLTLSAMVKSEIAAEPALMFFGNMDLNKLKTQSVKLQLGARAPISGEPRMPPQEDMKDLSDSEKEQLKENSGPIKIVAVTSNNPNIKAELNDGKVLITPSGRIPIGPLRSKVTVWNTSTHLKQLVIPVVGEVSGHVKTSAKYMEFGVVSQKTRRTLVLESDLPGFEVTGVEIQPKKLGTLSEINIADYLKYSLVTDSKGGVSVHFDLSYPPQLKQTTAVNTSGVFLVKTNDQDYKQISIPFFGILKQE